MGKGQILTDLTDVLPLVPSELLTLAVNDLRLAAEDEHYFVDMGEWHEPIYWRDRLNREVPATAVCRVCLAGAVIAGTMKAPIVEPVSPVRYGGVTRLDDVTNTDYAALIALDQARKGEWLYFIDVLNAAREAKGMRQIRGTTKETTDFEPTQSFQGELDARAIARLEAELLLRADHWRAIGL